MHQLVELFKLVDEHYYRPDVLPLTRKWGGVTPSLPFTLPLSLNNHELMNQWRRDVVGTWRCDWTNHDHCGHVSYSLVQIATNWVWFSVHFTRKWIEIPLLRINIYQLQKHFESTNRLIKIQLISVWNEFTKWLKFKVWLN